MRHGSARCCHAHVTAPLHNAISSGEQSTATLGGTSEPVTVAEDPIAKLAVGAIRATSRGPFAFRPLRYYSFISKRSCALTNERVVVALVCSSAPLCTMLVLVLSGASAFDSDSRSFSSGLTVHSA
jgi:hypothetical protein